MHDLLQCWIEFVFPEQYFNRAHKTNELAIITCKSQSSRGKVDSKITRRTHFSKPCVTSVSHARVKTPRTGWESEPLPITVVGMFPDRVLLLLCFRLDTSFEFGSRTRRSLRGGDAKYSRFIRFRFPPHYNIQ